MQVTDTTPSLAPRLRLRSGVAVLAVWTVLGLIESGKAYVLQSLRGVPLPWWRALLNNMPWWYTWALLTPLVFVMARRFPIERGRWLLASGAHVLAALVISSAHLLIEGTIFFYTAAVLVNPAARLGAMLGNFFAQYLMLNILTYGALVGGYSAWDFYRRFREREVRAAQLEARAARLERLMTEAQLEALRMQLQPHFLFNTLNAIAGLVRRHENAGAIRMLARLGDLLRLTLERDSPQRIPLLEELEFLDHYLEIERSRFADRLTVEVAVPDALGDALVPTLLLQPLVENAVRHGVARTPGPGHVVIRAERRGATLELEVEDSGPGFPGDSLTPSREGVGLANTRARLQQLYGARAELEACNLPQGGARVAVRLPYEPDPAIAHVEIES